MRNADKAVWSVIFASLLLTGSVMFAFGAGRPALTLNLPDGGQGAVLDEDDDRPDVTSRVARISFISGDVQIRRVGTDEWEKAALNLPLVEGDEVATSANARLEVQFNNYAHLRLDHDVFLKFTVLKDEGIALSLSQGTISIRATDLAKAAGYFEIDAPKTTVALQKAGSYRIDAGAAGDKELNVSVANGGEARVYSDNAGFTLKSGRGAKVFIDGDNAGEWETADAPRFGDDFETWALDRDAVIAKRIADAYYDKYYDQDIYGADDLDGYGEWIHTGSYGYVWRPYATSIQSYSDWTPYRYGHWRWVPPYGWTWVNDEPWGWATYHHGRWVYDNGYWVWAPYGYYRQSRSWWSPALVVINIVSSNVCWYPLPYHRHQNNNNWGGHGNGNHNPGGWGGSGGIKNPPTRRTPVIRRNKPNESIDSNVAVKLPRDRVPPNGVVSIDEKEFGTRRGGVRTATQIIAQTILTKDPDNRQFVDLPARKKLDSGESPDIAAARPRTERSSIDTKTGAAVRRSDAPLDQELRTTRIFGGRQQVKMNPDTVITTTNNDGRVERKTGAVDRQPPVRRSDDQVKVVRDDSTVTNNKPREDKPVRQPRADTPVFEKQVERERPKFDPPVRQPRSDPPPAPREKPRSDPPPAQRNEQPREKPREAPQPKREPKETEKPSRPSVMQSKEDGR